MGKQVVRYRTCDKCPAEVNAAVTDKLMFNGVRYDIDLCETHSMELFSTMMAWCDLGTKVGETTRFDQQQIAREVTVDLEPKKSLFITTVVEEEPEAEPAPPAPTPIRKVLADDPELPLTASRWTLTPHAKEKMQSRGFTLAEVLWAAERPEVSSTDKDAAGHDRRDRQLRTRGRCTAVVDPFTDEVITVLYAAGVEQTDRKAQG